VIDVSNFVATTPQQRFRVEFPTPNVVRNVEASAARSNLDTNDSTILLTWDYSDIAPDDFEGYNVYRTGPDGRRVRIVTLKSSAQRAWIDPHPVSGVEYDYELTQSVRQGVDLVESEPRKKSAKVNLSYAVLNSIDIPSYRVPIKFWRSRQIDHRGQEDIRLPWGSTKPVVVTGMGDYVELSIEAQFIDDTTGSAMDHVAALKNLLALRRIVCYRDPLGRRLFGLLSLVSEDDMRGKIYNARLRFLETAYIENI
jgi:hypothetical protein